MNIDKAIKILDQECYCAPTQFVEYSALRRILEALAEEETLCSCNEFDLSDNCRLHGGVHEADQDEL